MHDIIGKKWIYFLISGVIIVPGAISLILWRIKPSIDFTGGSLQKIQFQNPKKEVKSEDLRNLIQEKNIEVAQIQQSAPDIWELRTKPQTQEQHVKINKELEDIYGNVREVHYESVGPSVGKETTENAVKAVAVASLAIIVYIAIAFRQIPKPYSPFAFGVCAVIALIHDVLVVLGLFSLFGHFFGVEIDALFITALLTVMGFSVHDSIVVFDRIRENLRKLAGRQFAEIVNESILQTLVRSLSTSLTVLFTLTALLLFGGESIRWFTAALLVGIASGTYSSIFNAAPLLVVWEQWKRKKR